MQRFTCLNMAIDLTIDSSMQQREPIEFFMHITAGIQQVSELEQIVLLKSETSFRHFMFHRDSRMERNPARHMASITPCRPGRSTKPTLWSHYVFSPA
ncbi:hypothetical protein ACFY93_31445 [Streptomyces sp. NPDC008313]|uniref:hypothetical protein n=1 Tax=Streptomyces sp. NPDC008313 TaxID=3364826 RepID=UPI0036ECAAAC